MNKKSIFDYLKEMSKKAYYESYMWGPQRSIFAKLIYDFFYLVRFLSPLQFVKQIFRYLDQSKIEKKERVDFHAFHTELYLLVVLVFSIIIYILESLNAQYLISLQNH